MDDVVNRFARELADAIAAAVAENAQVEACREKARAAGFEMKVTLEAVVGFVSRSQSTALTKVTAPARVVRPRRNFEVTANDRRFLRSLRIAAMGRLTSVGRPFCRYKAIRLPNRPWWRARRRIPTRIPSP